MHKVTVAGRYAHVGCVRCESSGPLVRFADARFPHANAEARAIERWNLSD